MKDIQNYLKSLNPNGNRAKHLVYDSQYMIWRDGKYLGIATWTNDENVGDSFQIKSIKADGTIINGVYIADAWVELVVKEISNVSELFNNASHEFLCGVRSQFRGNPIPERPESDDFIQGYYFSESNDLNKRFILKP